MYSVSFFFFLHLKNKNANSHPPNNRGNKFDFVLFLNVTYFLLSAVGLMKGPYYELQKFKILEP